ncbi:MAG: polysaccharide deacetylase family protein [Candidatus Saganbacteria bacterium]|nr:polysaccharide deacetylase family protein [Candidatus Saganbacteria bacterium]
MKRTFILLIIALALLPCLAQAKLVYGGLDKRYVALTFDDGPSLGFTEKVLDIMARENVKGTFFLIGHKVMAQPELMARLAREGHELGNHTFTHSKVTWLGDDKLAYELKQTSQLISEMTGKSVKLFRPPHGTLNAAKSRLIQQQGYDIVLWTVNADDFYRAGRGMRSHSSIANRVLGQVKGGDVVLMHDDSQQLVDALPLIIAGLKQKGYSLVTVSELRRKSSQYMAEQKKEPAKI